MVHKNYLSVSWFQAAKSIGRDVDVFRTHISVLKLSFFFLLNSHALEIPSFCIGFHLKLLTFNRMLGFLAPNLGLFVIQFFPLLGFVLCTSEYNCVFVYYRTMSDLWLC